MWTASCGKHIHTCITQWARYHFLGKAPVLLPPYKICIVVNLNQFWYSILLLLLLAVTGKTDSAFPTVLLRQHLVTRCSFTLNSDSTSSHALFIYYISIQYSESCTLSKGHIFWETHPETFSQSSYVIPFLNSPSAREYGNAGMKKMKMWKRIPQHTWCKNTTVYKITHAKLKWLSVIKREAFLLPFQGSLKFSHTNLYSSIQSFSQAGSLFWTHAISFILSKFSNIPVLNSLF